MSARHAGLFEDPIWQMTLGERAAVQGVLSALEPALAIEVGTAEGACLRRIALHAGEVHSIDLVAPSIADLGDHVHVHTGDSHLLLEQVLEHFAADGRNVDFVLVDGDHSPQGVRRDVEVLLGSPSIGDTLILTHDTGNERVRTGLDAVPYGAYPKVAHVDLDFVPGHLGLDAHFGELWGGLGLIVVAAHRLAYGSGPAVQTDRHHGGRLLSIARDVLGGHPPDDRYSGRDPRAGRLADAYGHIDALEQRLAESDGDRQAQVAQLTAEVERQRMLAEHHRRLVDQLIGSASWRAGSPLRLAKRGMRALRRR